MPPTSITITGAAGLVGQNLIARLAARGQTALTGIDKHRANTATLARLHPSARVIEADSAQPGEWAEGLAPGGTLVQAHAQIGGQDAAAWMWRRIRRIGRSRRSLMQEQLGYIDGGSETLVRALCEAIAAGGGRIHLGAPVQQVVARSGRVAGVRLASGEQAADAVICTVPTPLVPRLCPDLPAAALDAYRAIANIGVVCVVLRLARSVSPHF